ncbi:acid sphingomyelinase [Penicillium malachiteum]|nr:acid sphingomyelinase [Penicillium malachiteum]
MILSKWLAFSGLLGAAFAEPDTSLAKRSTISDISKYIENTVTCAGRDSLLVVLQALAHLGNDDFVDVITSVCKLAGVEDDDPTNATRPESSGKTPIQVVHVMSTSLMRKELSILESYCTLFCTLQISLTGYYDYNCTKNIYCRPYTTADAPGNISYPAGEYRNSKCDAPLTLEESMYKAIQSLIPDASFTIFTGDVVEGAVWLVNETEVTNDLNDAYSSRMSKYLNLAYRVISNHNAASVNFFPPAAIDTTISSQWAYNTLSSDWSQWIGSSAASTANDYGSYSVKYSAGNLRIISFNTNFYYKKNFWPYKKTIKTDPSGQLAWLVNELDAEHIV